MNTEETIQKYATSKKIPGISVGLISKDGTNKEFHYGEIKKESGVVPTSDTIYEIGSMTKTFTAILAVKLQNQGLLSLYDDPITKFLPELANSDFEKNKITLYHLITHSSGIVDTQTEFSKNILAMIFRKNKELVFPPMFKYSTSEFLDEVLKIKLKINPGITSRYSNMGVGLVGKILERVTNSTYEDLIKNHICDELNLPDTRISLLEQNNDRLATGYLSTGKEAKPINIPAVMSAGSIRSTTSDMLKFLKANLGLNDESKNIPPVLKYCISTAFEPKMNPFIKQISSLAFGFKSIQMGLGWVVSEYKDDLKIAWHSGGTEGFSTIMAINPKKKTGCIVLTNKALLNTYKFGINLLKAIPN